MMISKKFFMTQASELTKKWIRHNVRFKRVETNSTYIKMFSLFVYDFLKIINIQIYNKQTKMEIFMLAMSDPKTKRVRFFTAKLSYYPIIRRFFLQELACKFCCPIESR